MLNGDGLRVVLWVAGCEHHCPNCQNPVTWDINGGLEFDEAAKKDPDASYGYLINKLGARILQTDSPAFMLNYLRSKGWHD